MGTAAVVTARLAVVAVAAGLIAGAAPARADDPPSFAAGQLTVSGDVANPSTVTLDQLRQYPVRDQTVTFESGSGTQHHTSPGAGLADVIVPAAPNVDAAAKHPMLPVAILATGSDGYAAVLAWGEVGPELTATPPVVAYSEDGQALPQPRLVVPADRDGGRYVANLVDLRVVNPALG